MRFTGAKTKREAVNTALADYNRRRRVADLVGHFGTFTSMMTNEEIEAEQLDQHTRRPRGAR